MDEETKENPIQKGPIVARIYGLPNIHKNNIPLRPISNTIGSPNYLPTKFLANNIKELVGRNDLYIKYSTHFFNKIKNLRVTNNYLFQRKFQRCISF